VNKVQKKKKKFFFKKKKKSKKIKKKSKDGKWLIRLVRQSGRR
jgi:hypothetical protein